MSDEMTDQRALAVCNSMADLRRQLEMTNALLTELVKRFGGIERNIEEHRRWVVCLEDAVSRVGQLLHEARPQREPGDLPGESEGTDGP